MPLCSGLWACYGAFFLVQRKKKKKLVRPQTKQPSNTHKNKPLISFPTHRKETLYVQFGSVRCMPFKPSGVLLFLHARVCFLREKRGFNLLEGTHNRADQRGQKRCATPENFRPSRDCERLSMVIHSILPRCSFIQSLLFVCHIKSWPWMMMMSGA